MFLSPLRGWLYCVRSKPTACAGGLRSCAASRLCERPEFKGGFTPSQRPSPCPLVGSRLIHSLLPEYRERVLKSLQSSSVASSAPGSLRSSSLSVIWARRFTSSFSVV